MSIQLNSVQDVADWIDACVLGDLRTLVHGIDAYYASPDHRTADGRPTGAGNFLLVAGCCSAIEYLGHVYAGKGSDEAKAIAFMNQFLAPINDRYREAGLLIWQCFRQGTVHRSWPKRIVHGDGTPQVITGAGSEPTDPHMAPLPDRAEDSFLVNGRQLLADLTRAFENSFRPWLLTEASEGAVERAKPQVLRVSGDTLRLPLEAVKRWNTDSRSSSCP